MEDITRIDTVQQYCDLFEVEALHPLVSVVNCYEVQLFLFYPLFILFHDDKVSSFNQRTYNPNHRLSYHFHR